MFLDWDTMLLENSFIELFDKLHKGLSLNEVHFGVECFWTDTVDIITVVSRIDFSDDLTDPYRLELDFFSL